MPRVIFLPALFLSWIFELLSWNFTFLLATERPRGRMRTPTSPASPTTFEGRLRKSEIIVGRIDSRQTQSRHGQLREVAERPECVVSSATYLVCFILIFTFLFYTYNHVLLASLHFSWRSVTSLEALYIKRSSTLLMSPGHLFSIGVIFVLLSFSWKHSLDLPKHL